MKKISLMLISIALVSVVLLAGCQSGTNPPATSTAASTTPDKTTSKPPPTTTALAGNPVAIPHALTGFADCLSCHGAGVGKATAIPANHAGRTNSVCTTCHKTAN